jgi:serine protease Do
VKAIVEQLRDHGNVARGWLGVQIQSLTPDMAASLGSADVKGAIVANVVDDSPAAKAGFQQGDVILALNGSEVDDSRDLTRKVGSLRAGERAEFSVLRDGKRQNVTAQIAKRDEQQLASATPTPNRQGNGPTSREPASRSSLGMELMPLTNDTRSQYNVNNDVNGVVVGSVDPNSEAAEKGLRPGDVIMSVGNKAVKTPADIDAGIAEARRAGRDNVLLLVGGDRGQVYVALKIGQG